MRRALLPLTVLLSLACSGGAAHAALPSGPDWYADPSVGATWTQQYITEADGTKLHADVLRPADLPADAKTPVILSIGPYFGHAGQEGVVEGDVPVGTDAGPSERFVDFVAGAHLMQRGYTYIMVDLRGFGGSTGCLDWAGPGEQADVKSAVEWAASQPWSTGKVGMYGKSYDGLTGLIGEVQEPKGLSAVVSQEPVYDDYDYLYTNGVRFANSVGTPALYDGIAATPGIVGGDGIDYLSNSVSDPACLAKNYISQALDSDHDSAFWKARDLTALAKGKAKVPLFLTQGFLEDNTKPEEAWDLFNEVDAPKRGWFGMWDHIRGNDQAEGDNVYPGWFDEVMRFYDHFVRDVPLADAPVDEDPAVEVQTSDGTWRAESSFPADDARGMTTPLKTGSYTDTADDSGSAEGGTPTGAGIWTISPPLAHDAVYSGVPHASLDLTSTLPSANTAIDVYDIDGASTATLLSREASLLQLGANHLELDLYGNDWQLPAGHRIGVRVTNANSEWWLPTPTLATVTLTGGTITLPFLTYARPDHIPGKLATRLATWKGAAPYALDATTVDGATAPGFALPGALATRPAPATGTDVSAGSSGAAGDGGAVSPVSGAAKTTTIATSAGRLTVRVALARHHRVVVYGSAPSGAKLAIALQRAGKTVLRRATTARLNAFRVTFTAKRTGRYRASVTATKGALRLKSVSGTATRR